MIQWWKDTTLPFEKGLKLNEDQMKHWSFLSLIIQVTFVESMKWMSLLGWIHGMKWDPDLLPKKIIPLKPDGSSAVG